MKFLRKKCEREFLQFSHCDFLHCITYDGVEITEYYCHHFSEKFRESNDLLKNFTLNWFDEKNLNGSEFPVCIMHRVEVTENSYLRKNLWKKRFNAQGKVLRIISRNILLVSEIEFALRFFYIVYCASKATVENNEKFTAMQIIFFVKSI